MTVQRRSAEGFVSIAGERLDIASLPQPPAWTEGAVCSSVDSDLFYPDKGGSTRAAKAVCFGCPVRTACLQYALDHDEWWGIWGGLSERERRQLKRESA